MSFKLAYLDKVPQVDNAFSLYGNHCHKLLEGFAKGEIQSYELADAYDKGYYDAVNLPFPPYPKGFAEKAYQQGLDYFMAFKGFGDEYEVISTEEKFTTNISGYVFSGIADLVLRNKVTGDIVIYDHKTKSPASMKKELALYTKQLYLYARYVFDRWKVFPASMSFNMVKSNELITVPFDIDEYNDAMTWMVAIAEEIILEFEWRVSPSAYYCQNICGVKYSCPAYAATTSYNKKGT